MDASDSSASAVGSDCSGNGAPGPEDDFNGDLAVGDVLDCEIAGVTALNSSVAATPGVQVGLVGLAELAAAADLDPAGSAEFIAPGFTGGDARPRIETVARSVVRHQIGLYDPRDLGGKGTNFDGAISVALSMLGRAPAGQKYIMFLSDGEAPVSDTTLAALTQSGVRLRSFGIGTRATCGKFGQSQQAGRGDRRVVPTGAEPRCARRQPDRVTAGRRERRVGDDQQRLGGRHARRAGGMERLLHPGCGDLHRDCSGSRSRPEQR